jgi:Na+/proline symporter
MSEDSMDAPLATPALIIAAVVCGGFAVLGAIYNRRQSTDADGFNTARGTTGPLWSGLSLVALMSGTWVLFSPGEMTSYTGVATLLGYALGMAAPLLILAFIGPMLVRRYPDAAGPGQMARVRWGAPAQLLISLLAVAYMGSYLVAELTAISGAYGIVAGVPAWATALLVAVATLSYAAWGGLRVTIFTDGVQAWFILPLLVAAFIGTIAAFGGWEAAQRPLAERADLMDLASRPGIEAGAMLILGIVAANLFDQSVWQRVLACRDDASRRTAFLIAAVGIIPVIILAGWFGLWYAARNADLPNASTALFQVIAQSTPTWVGLAVLALALVLVMSTLGSLANGLAGLIAADVASFRPATSPGRRLAIGRGVTIAAALIAVPIAACQPSVTYVFLVADLLCATAVVPVFAGLLGVRLPGWGLFAAVGAGMTAAIPAFPRTDFVTPMVDLRGCLHLPGDANAMLVSFALAITVSGVVAAICTLARRR